MVRIRVFGGLWIERGVPSTEQDFQPRRLALLSLLAVAGERGYSREKLIGLLWPERDPRHAHHALSQLVHILKRDLDPDLILNGSPQIRINGARVTSDYADFMQAQSEGRLEYAMELYQGPFLDGFYLNAGPEFERWVELERQHLARQTANMLQRLATQAAERGDHLAAADFWARLSEYEPLNSRAAAGLIGELAASGSVTSALDQARSYEGLVQRELGIAPDASVKTLVAQLRSQAGRLLACLVALVQDPDATLLGFTSDLFTR